METPVESKSAKTSGREWNYVDVQVKDGQRILRPTHVAFDRVIFAERPNLTADRIEIVTMNNGQSHSRQALVLPHEPSATYIPIQLISEEQKSPAKLIA